MQFILMHIVGSVLPFAATTGVCVCVCVCVCVHVLVFMCVCMYLCSCVCVCMHVHIQWTLYKPKSAPEVSQQNFITSSHSQCKHKCHFLAAFGWLYYETKQLKWRWINKQSWRGTLWNRDVEMLWCGTVSLELFIGNHYDPDGVWHSDE